MFRRGTGRVVWLFLFALLVERLADKLPQAACFVMVFAAVFVVDNLSRLRGGSDRPLFLEDVVLGIVLYAGFGYLSALLDAMLSAYTARHASPAFPAVLLALLDKAWPSETLSSKRR